MFCCLGESPAWEPRAQLGSFPTGTPPRLDRPQPADPPTPAAAQEAAGKDSHLLNSTPPL